MQNPMVLCLPLLLVAGAATSAPAQTAAASSPPEPRVPAGWARVQALPTGTTVHIRGEHVSLNCAFTAATDTTLTCRQRHSEPQTIPKADIRTIKVPHRLRSTLVGLGIGAGGGAVAGAATCRKGDFIGPGGCAAILGVPFGVLGAGIGAGTDFTHGTVYRAY